MVNECIRVGLEQNMTAKYSLRNTVYRHLKNGYNTSFISMAAFKAHAILKNYRRSLKNGKQTKKPYVWKRFIIIDSASSKLNGRLLSFPTKPYQFTNILLNEYVTEKLSNPDVKIGNITIRENEIIISYTQDFPEQTSEGYIGIDMNFENITATDSLNNTTIYDTSRITGYNHKARETLSHFRRNDHRIRKKLAQKYGKKQRNKQHNILHNIANQLTAKKMTPVLERLKYIRNQGRKGDQKGKHFRFRLNSWPRHRLQQIIDYKSKQLGTVPVMINPKGTSSKCSICGGKIILEENRQMKCSACGRHADRDVNASQNILKRGMRFVPIAPQGEAMKQSKDAEQIAVS
jgi:putative transposase